MTRGYKGGHIARICSVVLHIRVYIVNYLILGTMAGERQALQDKLMSMMNSGEKKPAEVLRAAHKIKRAKLAKKKGAHFVHVGMKILCKTACDDGANPVEVYARYKMFREANGEPVNLTLKDLAPGMPDPTKADLDQFKADGDEKDKQVVWLDGEAPMSTNVVNTIGLLSKMVPKEGVEQASIITSHVPSATKAGEAYNACLSCALKPTAEHVKMNMIPINVTGGVEEKMDLYSNRCAEGFGELKSRMSNAAGAAANAAAGVLNLNFDHGEEKPEEEDAAGGDEPEVMQFPPRMNERLVWECAGNKQKKNIPAMKLFAVKTIPPVGVGSVAMHSANKNLTGHLVGDSSLEPLYHPEPEHPPPQPPKQSTGDKILGGIMKGLDFLGPVASIASVLL